MSISTTTNRVTFAGNGSTTAFSFPYYFLANADLVVILTTAAGVATTQTITTRYTVTGSGVAAGGTITMITAPASGETLTVYRDPSATQEVDLIENDSLPAETVEQSLDRLTMICQRLKDRIDRSVILADGFVDSFTLTLPTDLATAGYFLQVNSTGDGFDVVAGITADVTVPAGTGILAKVSATATSARTITGDTNEIAISNGDGVSGNPTVGLADNPVIPGTEDMTVPVGTTAQRDGSVAVGAVRYNSTTSLFEFYQGSAWVNYKDISKTPTIQRFTSGSGTYTTPAGCKHIKVSMVGGGGGGAGSGTAGGTAAGDGGVTTFGTSLFTANGGTKGLFNSTISVGGTVTVSGGSLMFSATGQAGGGNAYTPTAGPGLAGASGGTTIYGGASSGVYNGVGLAAAANTGGGGGGAGASPSGAGNVHRGGGGASGGYICAIIASPDATYSYAVGAAGTAGAAGANGQAGGVGAAGIISVEEFYG